MVKFLRGSRSVSSGLLMSVLSTVSICGHYVGRTRSGELLSESPAGKDIAQSYPDYYSNAWRYRRLACTGWFLIRCDHSSGCWVPGEISCTSPHSSQQTADVGFTSTLLGGRINWLAKHLICGAGLTSLGATSIFQKQTVRTFRRSIAIQIFLHRFKSATYLYLETCCCVDHSARLQQNPQALSVGVRTSTKVWLNERT